MTFSIARERYTPLLNSPRNFDGIVSRFLASSVCSKVPVKAKAHKREGRGQSIRGGGVGGAPPPRNGFARCKVPHNVPLCNMEPALGPTSVTREIGLSSFAGILCWDGSTPVVQDPMRLRVLQAPLPSAALPGDGVGGFRPLAATERGDERRGDEQEHGRDEQ